MNVIDMTSPDVNNGTGFRVTLWIAGCRHKCKGCQNPHTWNYNQGKPLRTYWKRLKDELEKPYIYGLTLSGGDPLDQSNLDLLRLYFFLKKVKRKFPHKDIWIYSGYTYEEIQTSFFKKLVLKCCDVLVDGPYNCYMRDTSLPFRGSTNQQIIKLKDKK